MWDHVAYALKFIDCDSISARCRLTKFSLFATAIEASILRMLHGFPDVSLSGPIKNYILKKGGWYHLRWEWRQILYDKVAVTDKPAGEEQDTPSEETLEQTPPTEELVPPSEERLVETTPTAEELVGDVSEEPEKGRDTEGDRGGKKATSEGAAEASKSPSRLCRQIGLSLYFIFCLRVEHSFSLFKYFVFVIELREL